MIDSTALRTLCEQQPVARVASVDLSQLLDENAALRAKTEEMQRRLELRLQMGHARLRRNLELRGRLESAESRLAALKEVGRDLVAGAGEYQVRKYVPEWFNERVDAFKAELRSDP